MSSITDALSTRDRLKELIMEEFEESARYLFIGSDELEDAARLLAERLLWDGWTKEEEEEA